MVCIGFLSGSALSIESSLVWRCQFGLAPAYLHYSDKSLSASVGPVSVARSSSAERGVQLVQFARAAAMQNRAFSVAGPRVWNDLPQELRLLRRLCTDQGCRDTF